MASEMPLHDQQGLVVAVAQLDDADAALFGAMRWWLHRSDTKVYAVRIAGPRGRQVRWFLHRAVMGLAPDDKRQVDHINGDTLDNRRQNLRIVSPAQNAQNQGSRGGSSRHRGVSWDKCRSKWQAQAQLNGRKVTIGRFADEDDAAEAVCAWRREHMPFSQEGTHQEAFR